MSRPGPRNLITDIDGIRVGNADDLRVRTGVTVILPDRRTLAAGEVRGGAPGTREVDVLGPTCLVDAVDAVVLSGGSAFGLDAAQGTMGWLLERGRGFSIGTAVVPIVPAAILFDLLNDGDKDHGDPAFYRTLAEAACRNADVRFDLGNSGAGMGAVAGGVKGGLGSASLVCEDGLQVGALIAANPVGSVLMPGQPVFWAWSLERDGELGGQRPPEPPMFGPHDLAPPCPAANPGANTTIGVVATNAALTRAEALRVAMMAHDGLARAIWPSHTPFDGDTLFVLATGTWPMPAERSAIIYRVGGHAADCVARATARGVYEARTLGNAIAFRDRFGAKAGVWPEAG